MKQLLSASMLIIGLGAISANAHTSAINPHCQVLDKNLNHYYTKLWQNSHYADNNEQQFTKYSKLFASTLAKTINDKQSITCNYPKLSKNSVQFFRSQDNRLQLFSYDTANGGTMHEFATLGRIIDKGKIYPIDLDGDISMLTGIGTFLINGQTIYAITTMGIYSTQLHSQSIQLFTIKQHKLTPAKLFIDENQQKTHTLSIEYSFFSIIDRPNRTLINIKPNNTFSIAQVVDDKEFFDGKVTNNTITYRFNQQQGSFVPD